MSKKFIPTSISWKHVFVKQSNLIDPQPGYPGSEPGHLMFDNHLVALDFAISDGWELSEHTPLDLHRLLTKNIDFFENSNYSGRYRTQDVWIGHEVCPHFIKIPELMKIWFDFTNEKINKFDGHKESALEIAWAAHHMFQVIHPFIDGNGRTGRLLHAKVMHDLGMEPEIVLFSDRFIYYDSIQYFRDQFWSGSEFYLNDILN